MSYSVSIVSDLPAGLRSFYASASTPGQLIYFSTSAADASLQMSNLIYAIQASSSNTQFIQVDGSNVTEERPLLHRLAVEITTTPNWPSWQYVIIFSNFDPVKLSSYQSPLPLDELNRIFYQIKVLVVYVVAPQDSQQNYVSMIENNFIKLYDQRDSSCWSYVTNQIKIFDPDLQAANQAAAANANQVYQASATTTSPTAQTVKAYITSATFVTDFVAEGGTASRLSALLTSLNSKITNASSLSDIQSAVLSLKATATYTVSDIAALSCCLAKYIIMNTATSASTATPDSIKAAALASKGISKAFKDAVSAISSSTPNANVMNLINAASDSCSVTDLVYGFINNIQKLRNINTVLIPSGTSSVDFIAKLQPPDPDKPFIIICDGYDLTSGACAKALSNLSIVALKERRFAPSLSATAQFFLATPLAQCYLSLYNGPAAPKPPGNFTPNTPHNNPPNPSSNDSPWQQNTSNTTNNAGSGWGNAFQSFGNACYNCASWCKTKAVNCWNAWSDSSVLVKMNIILLFALSIGGVFMWRHVVFHS